MLTLWGAKINGLQVLSLISYHILDYTGASPSKVPDCTKHIDFIKSVSLIKQKHAGSKDMAVLSVVTEMIDITYRTSYLLK